MDRSLHGVGLDDCAIALVGEQVHRVRRVVPKQVVGPAARLAQRVHVAAPKEVGLHIHLLDVERAALHLLVHVLVAGIEAAGMAAHRDPARFFLQRHHGLRILQAVGQRNLDLHMLAGPQARHRLCRMHLRRRAQDDSVHFLQGQALGQFGRDVTDGEFRRNVPGFLQLAANQRNHFDAIDFLDAFQVLDAEGAGAGKGDSNGHCVFSRIRWPTAVLDAGTW